MRHVQLPSICYKVYRWYQPGVGTYSRADPLLDQFFYMGDQHPYLYVRGNPSQLKDPLGLYGTNNCTYYDTRCFESGGQHYCKTAPSWCDRFPKYPDPDPYSRSNPDPATNGFGDKTHTVCHAKCYTVCYLQKWGEDPVLGRPLG